MTRRSRHGGERRPLARGGYWLAGMLSVCLVSAGCVGLETGPSLSDVVLSNIGVRPTVGDASLCCCHVVATARNGNSVAVHATLKFAALDGSRQEIARTVYFIEQFRPGATVQIDAPGLLFECSRVQSVAYEVSVRGLTAP